MMTISGLQDAPGSDRVAVAPGASLGNNADLTTPPYITNHLQKPKTELNSLIDISENPCPPPTTVKAWYLRSHGREILQKAGLKRRMTSCGYKITRGLQGVSLYQRPDRAYGRVGGICMCGQSLACPVCAPRIAAFRASEVAECFKRATAGAYEAKLVTFTMPHSANSPLSVEIETFQEAWKHYQKGQKKTRREQDSLGNHVAREVTWGALNGWNFHQHQLRYDRPGTFNDDLNRAQWLSALQQVCRFREGADKHAFDSGHVGTEAGARYVAKLSTSVEAQARSIGSEIASSATKGKNLASLLLAATQGDAVAAKTWCDGVAYITAKKISSVRWSRGLRSEVGLSVEKSDAEIAKDEILKTDLFLGALLPWQWKGIIRWRAEFPLVIAANNGIDAVNSFLTGLELGQLNDEPPASISTPINGDYAYAPIQSPISYKRAAHHHQAIFIQG